MALGNRGVSTTVLLTGVSSFTGYWFAGELVSRGHRVIATLTGPRESYRGLRAKRLAQLDGRVEFLEGVSFGDDIFCRTVEAEGVEVVGAHGARVAGYRDPAFPYLEATAANVNGIDEVVGALSRVGGRLVVTGSVFEADEGIGSGDGRAFSEYGLSKTLSWQVFRYFAVKAAVPLVKFVIPNPFGPFEDERFVAHLMRTWGTGGVAEVRTPLYVRDNIHVQWLASAYADAVATDHSEAVRFVRPSGYIESQGSFARRVAAAVGERTGWECRLELAESHVFEEPAVRINVTPMQMDPSVVAENRCWDALVQWYLVGPRGSC